MSETHQRAVRLLRAGHGQESIQLLSQALREQESSEVWNDWATALNLWVSSEAERGYRRALELDPENRQAAVNLGILLSGQRRIAEAVPFLEKGLPRLDEPQRQAVDAILEQCQALAARPARLRAEGSLESTLNRSRPNGRPLIYFFHIPKTSGTSFRRFLVSLFGEDRVSPPMIWDALPEYSSSKGKWEVWVGHFGGLLPFILRSWPRMVTILRNPVDRTLSHINHVRRDTGHPLHPYAQGLSVLEYCRHPKLRRSIDNYQARFLASLSFALAIFKTVSNVAHATSALAFEDALFSLDRHYDLLESALRALVEMEMVGIAEAHHQTLRLFSHKFSGPSRVESYHENKAGESQAKRSHLSAEELECIQEMTRIDQLVYEHARERFQLDCRQANLDRETQPPE